MEAITFSDHAINNKKTLPNLIQTHTNTSLNQSLKDLVKTERKLLIVILDYLAEVKKRMLYAELGYSSLFSYCVKELGYSESAAMRRIQALKLSSEIPEIKEKLKSGALNLSTVSMAQSFFQKEKNLMSSNNLKLNTESTSINTPALQTTSAKIDFLKTLEYKSIQEVQKAFVSHSPEIAHFSEQYRPITSNLTELKLTLNSNQFQKLRRVKELRPDFKTTAELLEWCLDQSLKKLEPINAQSHTTVTAINPLSKSKKTIFKTVCKSLRQKAHLESMGRCTFVSKSGQRCLETFGLEIDHIWPKAKGGLSTQKNLRTLCKTHNQLHAIKHFTKEKLQRGLDLGVRTEVPAKRTERSRPKSP